MKVTVTNIIYDMDEGEDAQDLPTTMDIIFKDNLCGYELEDAISDVISDKTGYCVTSFLMLPPQ